MLKQNMYVNTFFSGEKKGGGRAPPSTRHPLDLIPDTEHLGRFLETVIKDKL